MGHAISPYIESYVHPYPGLTVHYMDCSSHASCLWCCKLPKAQNYKHLTEPEPHMEWQGEGCWATGSLLEPLSPHRGSWNVLKESHMKGLKWEPQSRELKEYARNTLGIYLPGSLYSCCFPTVFLGLPIWGSHLPIP